jgi:hypothetical protein
MRPKKTREERISVKEQEIIWQLHEGLGHMSRTGISTSIRKGLWRNVPECITAAKVDAVMSEAGCAYCAMYKRRQSAIPQGLGTFTNVIAYRLSMDRKGPYKIGTIYGCKWVVIFICCASGLVMPVLARSGDGDAILEAISWVALYMLTHGHVVKEILTDKGSAEGSEEVVREAAQMGIRMQPMGSRGSERQSSREDYTLSRAELAVHAAGTEQPGYYGMGTGGPGGGSSYQQWYRRAGRKLW